MKSPKKLFFIILILGFCFSFSVVCKQAPSGKLQFSLSFPQSIHPDNITGRVFVCISEDNNPEPRLQAGSWSRSVPFFGRDVADLAPGEAAVINEHVLGYPTETLKDIPEGDYYVQGLINVYTKFNRTDGHEIWAHMDQWEGQQFNRSPGNLFSEPVKVHLDPQAGYNIEMNLDQKIPPIEVPADTQWVKRIKIQSDLLTKFWGHPIYIGATILLPKGYEEHPDAYYPVHYRQGHFSLQAPYGFRTDEPDESDRRGKMGYEFYQTWISEDFPRMFVITFQHPCPYFDDSYAVNSENCGPYGDALLTELIPYLEDNFRIIPEPYARVLSGGSTGGWESLALQVFHPDFFGGAWSFCPDPIDFRYYILTNIYDNPNAFFKEAGWMTYDRPFMRDVHGQVMVTMQELSQMEAVLGSKGRSGQQLDIWQAVYAPVGEDGYPQEIWDKRTGEINRDVARECKKYDLYLYIKENWAEIGPSLVGDLHLITGDMDNYYLNEAVYELEDFLESTTDPYYAGSFQYGRPRKGHGWSPYGRSSGELEKIMAEHITKNAPAGAETRVWKYK